MRQQRWFPVAMLAVGLFVINAVTRLIIKFGFNSSDNAQTRATVVMFALIGAVLGGWTFLVAQRDQPSSWLPQLGLGAVTAMLLTVLVGPFLSGGQPFADGAGSFFAQIWLYAGFAIVGTLLGYWVAVTIGRDYRSRSLKAFTQARAAKPHRVVRR